MRIPQAKDDVNKIAPNVGGIRPPQPVSADSGIGKAGIELKQSMQNAMDGFAKLYVADQRADAIAAFNDYNRAVQDYRDSAEIDPETGNPIGFTQLRGDQVNENSLQKAQLKVQEARAKFNQSLRGFVPDLQDEFGMRADEAQANFDTATNAYFLKAKYEKAKNAADLDNDNIVSNTSISQRDTSVLEQAKNNIKRNYMSYLQDDKAAERQAKAACEKIIQNNVTRMKRDGDPQSYDQIRGMLHFYNKKGYLSDASEDALLHDIDLESANWKFNQLDTTQESMSDYLRNNTKNLSAEEKSEFIMKAIKRDTTNARSGSSKNVSKMADLLDWVTTRQARDFSNANEYGFNFETAPGQYENVSEVEASRFRSDFLSFADMIFSSVNTNNQDKLQTKGLEGVLTEEQIRMFTDPTSQGYKGNMMRMAYERVDSMFKNGELPALNKQEAQDLKTRISNIRENNPDYANRLSEYRALTQQVSGLLDKKTGYTQDDIDTGVRLYNRLSQFKGSDVAKNGDKSYDDLERNLADMLSAEITPANVNRNSVLGKIKNFFPKGWMKQKNSVFATIDDWFKTGDAQVTANRHHQIISELADIAYSDGKRSDGSNSPLQLMGKEALDMMWEDTEGKGLVILKRKADGTLDLGTQELRKISFNDTVNSDGTVGTIQKALVKAQARFGNYLNNKYKTQVYSDFNKIDSNNLTPEEKQALIEITREEMLKSAGFDGYTYMPVNSVSEPSRMMNKITTTVVSSVPGASPAALTAFALNDDFSAQSEYERQLNNIPPIGSFNGDLTSIKPSAFNGGAASSSDIVKLVSNGYTSFEDYMYEYDSKRPEQFFSPQGQINLMLNATTPYGLSTIHNKEDYAPEGFANELINRLSQDNPGMQPTDFLKPDTFGYEVSNKTLEWAKKEYNKVRKKQLIQLNRSFLRGDSLERMKKYDMGVNNATRLG